MSTFVYLDIDQGSDFRVDVVVDNDNNPNNFGMDISGFTARSKFSKNYGSSKVYNLDAEIIDFDKGILALELDGASSLSIPPGRYVFDVEIYSESYNVRMRVLEGILTLSPSITRS
jgi:hypothetical protein